jgi:hypothetical protein
MVAPGLHGKGIRSRGRESSKGHQLLAKAFPLLSIVVVLFPMGAFMLASPPLLILKHETPVDGHFIRNLFNVYYIVVITIAAIGAAGCALIEQRALALAMVGLVVFVLLIRRGMLSKMDRVRDAINRGESMAVPRFRRLHIAGMVLNVVQLGTVAWGMTRLVT